MLTPYQIQLHEEHKTRMARINSRAISAQKTIVSECEIGRIQDLVSAQYGICRKDLLSDSRETRIVRAKMVGMYLCKVVTDQSFAKIGKKFGGKHHTTVLNAFQRIGEMMVQDVVLASEIEFLKTRIEA